jgi:hypothetical protein
VKRVVGVGVGLTLLVGCTQAGPPGSRPPPASLAPSARPAAGQGGRLPEIVLTADLSEPPADWELVAEIPYGPGEEQLGLRFVQGDLPNEGIHRSPASFAVGEDGSFWILDTVKARLAHYSSRGGYLAQVTGLTYGRGKPLAGDVAQSRGRLYVLEEKGVERAVRVVDAGALSPPVVPADDGSALVVTLLYPSPEEIVGWVGGYVERLTAGPRGFAELDIPGSGRATSLAGVPVAPSRWIGTDAPDDQDIEIGFHSPATTSVQPIHVDVVTELGPGGRTLTALVGPGIEAILPGAVGISVRISATDGDRQVGGTWYLQVGTEGESLVWERLPDEHVNGEVKRRHFAAGADGSVYVMLSTEAGEEIYRRP